MDAEKRGPGRPRNNPPGGFDDAVHEPIRHAIKRRPTDAEILAEFSGENEDPFAIPRDLIPEGFEYEWKSIETLGKSASIDITRHRRAGWREVPNGRHKFDFPMMPDGTSDDAPIIKDGLCLMEMPADLHYRKFRYTQLLASQQIQAKEAEFLQSAPGQGPRHGTLGGGRGVRKTRGPVSVE
jgi:hypothetical protein